MAYERHGVFNIGPMGDPIADPAVAEQLAMAKFQASRQDSERMIEEQAKSRESQALLAQIARSQEISDRDWKHQNVTLPAQQLAMLEAAAGLQGKERDRELEEAKFGATLENRQYTRSYRERKAKREAETKRKEFQAETEQEKLKNQYELDKFEKGKEYDFKQFALRESLKARDKQEKDREARAKAAKTAEDQSRKQLIADHKKAQDSITQGEIYNITMKLSSGKDLEDSDIALLKNDLYYRNPLEKLYAAERLSAALDTWRSMRMNELEQERAKHKGASTGIMNSLFSYLGGASGDAYVKQKMGPEEQKFKQKEQELIAIINQLEQI